MERVCGWKRWEVRNSNNGMDLQARQQWYRPVSTYGVTVIATLETLEALRSAMGRSEGRDGTSTGEGGSLGASAGRVNNKRWYLGWGASGTATTHGMHRGTHRA